MFEHPVGYSPARAVEAKRRIDSLCAIFRPHVEAAVADKARAQLAFVRRYDDVEVRLMMRFAGALAIEEGMPTSKVKEQMRLVREECKSVTGPMSDEEMARCVTQAVDAETLLLASTWLDLLLLVATINDERLAPATFDESMLPTMDPDVLAAFRDSCNVRLADEITARAVLAAVRTALPSGQPLPEDAKAFLCAEGVILA
jgi:hypothetical protein